MAVVAALIVAACGGGDDDAGGMGASSGSVNIVLREWLIESHSSVSAGEVTFNVRSVGAEPHEFVVAKTDLAANELPVSNGVVDEILIIPLGRTGNLNNGDVEAITVLIESGSYVILCNIPTHYDQGMYASFMVN